VTRVLLVRHGATVLTAEDRFAGASNPALSEEGREQARRLGERLREVAIAAVYASPLDRARETAELIAAPHALPVATRPELREIDHGHWEGLTRAEVCSRFPDEVEGWDADPYTFAPAGGETGLSVAARSLPALLALVRAHPGETVLAVSHKATIRLLLCALLGFDPRRYRDVLEQSPAALNILDFKESSRARLVLYNDTSHIEPRPLPESPGARLSPWWGEPRATP
jgi:broad specificity phosphatase PhoE